MEIKTLFTCFVLFMQKTDATVVTDQTVIGMMATTVTVPCKIIYSDTDPWFLAQWKRRQDDVDKTIVTLTNTFSKDLTPRWSNDPDLYAFKSRARTDVSMNETVVNFDLSIYDFSCSDVGVFICEVTSNTKKFGFSNVTIMAKPLPPKIHSTSIILEINNTYTLECDAVVGIPPTDLNWYYREPGEGKFIRVQTEPEQEIKPGIQDCRPRAIQRLEVTGSEKSSGTTFRCVVNSSSCGAIHEDKICFADVTVEVPAEIKPEPTYQVTCEGNECNKNTQDNGSSIQKGSLAIVVFAGLLGIISVSGMR